MLHFVSAVSPWTRHRLPTRGSLALGIQLVALSNVWIPILPSGLKGGKHQIQILLQQHRTNVKDYAKPQRTILVFTPNPVTTCLLLRAVIKEIK